MSPLAGFTTSAASTGRYVIYLRKSRADVEAEAHGEGETLARHERALLDLARRLQLDVADIYREIVSGETIAARPVMQRLLGEVDAGVWDGVLVMEVERLARGDTIDQGLVAQAFRLTGTKIITPTKTYDPNNEFDEEYFEFGLFMSRREYKTINRRLQRGRLASVQEGKYVNSQPPYGYQRYKLPNEKGFSLRPDPDQAPVVRLIFQLYTHGETQEDGSAARLGVSKIANRLNRDGIKPKHGGLWNPASIRDLLINPVYIGKVRWNFRKVTKRRAEGRLVASRPREDSAGWTLADGRHEPLVDELTFWLAQEYMAQNHAPAIRERGVVQNPLAGLVVCGLCGHKMQRRPYLKQGRPDTLLCPVASCKTVASDLAAVERSVLDALRAWAKQYRVELGDNDEPSNPMLQLRRQAIQKRKSELAKLELQRGNLHDLLERGVYDTDTFLERSRTIASRIKQVSDDLAKLRAEAELDFQRECSKKTILPRVEKLLAVYDQLPTPQAKNTMLKDVLEKVVYTKSKSGRWADPNDFQISIYPRIDNSPAK